MKIDANLTWQYHLNDLSIKLNRANALLFKMTKYVSLKILRSIYFAIFDSYLSYCCLVWAQNFNTIQQILILQKRLFLENKNTTILGDIQKACDIPTNIFIIKEKKMTNNNHSYFYMDMKKSH